MTATLALSPRAKPTVRMAGRRCQSLLVPQRRSRLMPAWYLSLTDRRAYRSRTKPSKTFNDQYRFARCWEVMKAVRFDDPLAWHCEADAVGIHWAGICSPGEQIHSSPCGWVQ